MRKKRRIITFFICFAVFFGISIFFFSRTYTHTIENKINYSETGNINYKVLLKENDFYDSSNMNENMFYVSSLIDKVNLTFNYKMLLDYNYDMNFNYIIKAKLHISDAESGKDYYNKEYTLYTGKDDIKKNNNININKNIEIQYDYYNDIANTFRSNYNVDTKSELVVYLEMLKQDKKNSFDKDESLAISIPLSQKSIDIKLDSTKLNNSGSIKLNDEKISISNIFHLIISIIFALLSILNLIAIIKLLLSYKKNKSAYQKFVDKILIEYDRLIVNTKSLPDFKDYNVLKIESFDELLDVRDNLKIPIMYYIVKENYKSHFYILNEKNLYLFTLRERDLENE